MYVYGLDAAGKPTTVFGPYEDAGPNADGRFRSGIVPGVAAVGEINGSWPFTLARISRIDGATLQLLRDSDDPGLRETEAERKAPRRELHPCSWRGRNTVCGALNGVLLYQGDMIADPRMQGASGRRRIAFRSE